MTFDAKSDKNPKSKLVKTFNLKVSSSFGGSCNVSWVHLDKWTKWESVNPEILAGFKRVLHTLQMLR